MVERVRPSRLAGSWYPGAAGELAASADRLCESWPARAYAGAAGGIVPHAGWMYSGRTAAAVFAAVCDCRPETCVVFGAVHVYGVDRPALSDHAGWQTPLGIIEVDIELGQATLESGRGLIEANGLAHRDEHSIEVEIPFIQRSFPDARLLAIMVPPDPDAARVGEAVAAAARQLQRSVLFFGSTDLTHYGPRFGFVPKGTGLAAHQWAKANNDRRMLDLIAELRAGEIVGEAARSRNACGPGAAAAAVAAARAWGSKRAAILEHTTSYEVAPEAAAEDFVGYAAAAFIA